LSHRRPVGVTTYRSNRTVTLFSAGVTTYRTVTIFFSRSVLLKKNWTGDFRIFPSNHELFKSVSV
jgi:hypothetical protein